MKPYKTLKSENNFGGAFGAPKLAITVTFKALTIVNYEI